VSTLTRAGSLRPRLGPDSTSPTEAGVVGVPERLRDGTATPPPTGRLAPDDGDESLVADPRGGLTPSQMVERKLLSLLDGQALPVSHVQMMVLPRSRRGK
jgi:hypothetical protein